jgi:uncharacterized repeat protein (TIGR03843 family)
LSRATDLRAELRDAALEVTGRFADASNLTVLARTSGGLSCVYKPISGERPLWDFPSGTLARREVAMALLAEALGWAVVPETVLRADGPMGPGACQRYIESAGDPVVRLVAEPFDGWLLVARGEDEHGRSVALVHREGADLRRMALLDAIANNADRKGSHLLTDAAGAVWGIDHGLTFHGEDKLRTVLWGFAEQPVAAAELQPLERLAEHWSALAERLAPYLAQAEIDAARDRLADLLAVRRYPAPEPGWPRLPWPPL